MACRRATTAAAVAALATMLLLPGARAEDGGAGDDRGEDGGAGDDRAEDGGAGDDRDRDRAVIHDADGDGRLDVLVLYDAQGQLGGHGAAHALQLINLLGHFPEIDATAQAAGGYEAGGLLNHELVFYVGSIWEAPIAPALFEDFWATDRPVVWIAANLWQLIASDPERFERQYGLRYRETAGQIGEGAQATFFRDVAYKGQVLRKLERWDAATGRWLCDPTIAVLDVVDAGRVEVLANIAHSGTGEVIPWVVRAHNLTVVADHPLRMVSADGPYLAFTDLLHDLVGIDHALTRAALFRLDDVHPRTDPALVDRVTAELSRDRQRPWNIALIPGYRDPYGVHSGGEPDGFDMDSPRAEVWREAIEHAMDRGARLVLHGYTHQYDATPNPTNAVTASDHEFWDAVHDSFLMEDSLGYVATRLSAANALLEGQGWSAWAFEAPLDRASPLDHLLFPSFYRTHYGRVVYEPFAVRLPDRTLGVEELRHTDPRAIRWEQASVLCEATGGDAQLLPYPIERDVYGQRVIPENLGRLTPPQWVTDARQVRTVDDLLESAERALVNRCAYASVSYDPQLMTYEGEGDVWGPAALRRLIEGLEYLGYRFVQPAYLDPPRPRFRGPVVLEE